MVWTMFVLDFDGTYDMEPMESIGVQPTVYLIPLEKQKTVENCAMIASMEFNEDESNCCWCIGDYFEAKLKEKGIEFKEIGSIDLTFGERQEDYIADYIPRVIV